MEAVRSPQVLPLLAERIRQPWQPAHLHSDSEVLAFHMRRADLRGLGIPMTGTLCACVTSGGLYQRWLSGFCANGTSWLESP
jgi:hypothetical protein